MFSKSSKGNGGATPPTPPAKPATPSLISIDLKIVGDLQSDGEIHIDGTVEGDIRTKTLLIGETANITGAIIAEKIAIHGTVNGQIKAEHVKLAKSAHVVGDILHEDLTIEQGAFLEGHCKRIAEPKAMPVKPATEQVASPATAPSANNALNNAAKPSDGVKKVAVS